MLFTTCITSIHNSRSLLFVHSCTEDGEVSQAGVIGWRLLFRTSMTFIHNIRSKLFVHSCTEDGKGS